MTKELSAQEAADALGVHRQTLSRWVTRGRLKPERREAYGKHIYTEEELQRFLRSDDIDIDDSGVWENSVQDDGPA